MAGNISNSQGLHVAVVGTEIFDLTGRKLYDLKGPNIYRPSGELVGHMNEREARTSVLRAPQTGYFPAILLPTKLNAPQRQHLSQDSLRAPGTNPE